MSIDVEDFHNLHHRQWLDREMPPTAAVADNTRRLLELFASAGTRATFFMLGEVAEAFPSLVREIAGAGHELGIHGFRHRALFQLSPDQFRREVGDAKAVVEELTGAPVLGHRAPAFSMLPRTRWALDVLVELGFAYDSSIFPVAGSRYGWPGSPPSIHELRTVGGGAIVEAPLTTVDLYGRRLPAGGGGYLRHLPYRYTRWALGRVGKVRPAIVYLHPYEIERPGGSFDSSAVPRRRALRAFLRRASLRRNRHTVEPKLIRLLSDFQFAPLRQVIARQIPDFPGRGA